MSMNQEASDPHPLFLKWYVQARDRGQPMVDAMTLATVDASGRPDARVVLFRGLLDGGFSFYTNYHSKKGRQLEADPRAALVFWWETLRKQVRVQGRVTKLSDARSDAYFSSRDYGKRIGAWASPQSEEIPNRAFLKDRYTEFEQTYPDSVPRPPHWGGFTLIADEIEFWNEEPNRLHQRLQFKRDAGQWRQAILAP